MEVLSEVSLGMSYFGEPKVSQLHPVLIDDRRADFGYRREALLDPVKQQFFMKLTGTGGCGLPLSWIYGPLPLSLDRGLVRAAKLAFGKIATAIGAYDAEPETKPRSPTRAHQISYAELPGIQAERFRGWKKPETLKWSPVAYRFDLGAGTVYGVAEF